MRFKLLFLMLTVVLSFSFPSFAQRADKVEVVRLVYFFPKNRPIVDSFKIEDELNTLVKSVQDFYRNEMIRLGFANRFDDKTFDFKPVEFYAGEFDDTAYVDPRTGEFDSEKVIEEIAKHAGFNLSRDIHLIATNMDLNSWCGAGRPFRGEYWSKGLMSLFKPENRAWAIFPFPQSNACSELDLGFLIAHELGHAFGLEHDFRTGDNIMSYNNKKLSDQTLSPCAAEWLEVCRAFNFKRPGFSGQPIGISDPDYSLETTGLHISFELSNFLGGLHSAQLHVMPTIVPKGFFPESLTRTIQWSDLSSGNRITLYRCKSLNPNKATIEFVYSEISSVPITDIELSVIDKHGNLVQKQFKVPINYPPVIKKRIEDMQLIVGSTPRLLEVAAKFSDPNGDQLDHSVQVTNRNVADAKWILFKPDGELGFRSFLEVTPKKVGSTAVTIKATDPTGLSAKQSFKVTVQSAQPNQRPVAINTIPDQTLKVGNSLHPLDMSNYFYDPDGDVLIYAAWSKLKGIVDIEREGSQITITAIREGSTTIVIRATDPKDLRAFRRISVTVTDPEIPGSDPIVTPPITVDTSNDNNTRTSDQNPQINNQDICERTLQIRNKILRKMDIGDCSDVKSGDLGEITSLKLHEAGITTLKRNDFEGFTSLDRLDLSDNSLKSLPIVVFNGLTALSSLDLYNNSLRSLPVGVFDGLSVLKDLDLGGNSLNSLSAGVFDGLGALETFELDGNSLSSLPIGIFERLNALKKLDLQDNSLRSLPIGVFNGLGALEILELNGNSLSSLPVGIFDGLGALRHLELDGNSLSSLPIGIFKGLNALESLDLDGNQLTALPAGIFDDVLDTLKASSLDLDNSLKATFGFRTTVQDVAKGETVQVEVNLSRSLPVAVRVPYTIGGTVTADDYTNLHPLTELLFLAGETSKEITFTLLENADPAAGTVSLTLSKMDGVKLRKSDGSGPDAKLYADMLLNAPHQRVHNITVTVSGESVSRPMYWTGGDNKIYRSKLDGTQVQVLFDGGDPRNLALDISSGKMYWVDHSLGRIRRANLDGSGVVNLVTDLGAPTGFALDVSGGKMYWLDYHFDKIQRANLNGSGIEDLVTGLDKPLNIALDVSGGKMYWSDTGIDKIQRANLNGTNVEDLVTGLSSPRAIALDVLGSKMYWVDSSANKIQRANFNGTNVEDLVTNFDIGADSLALDMSSGKMYWADNEGDKICRANLDGTQIEQLYSGSYPIGIALAIGLGAAAHAAPSTVYTNSTPILPSEAALLPNYPNPFNPETWIPYQLAEPADVTLTIYAVNGTVVRTLALGHQPAGVYQSKSRAAYWDGKNAVGEPVASGVYFFTLKAGEFTATRKMLIRK